MSPVDVVTVEVIGNNLQTIAEEMGALLIKAAYSSNIKERRDCSAALLDAHGETLAQAEHIPLHLGSMLGTVQQTLQTYALDDIRPGDMFIANDTYVAGGTHLPDITVAAPCFYQGQLVAFAANIGHHAEVGGVRGPVKDVFEEGIRIPAVKIFRDGKLDQGVLDLLVLNCRLPQERRGDFRAQFSAAQLGVRRVTELCDKFGVGVFQASIAQLFDYSERKIRRGLSRIPDGCYTFCDYMEDAGEAADPIPIQVAITIQDDTLIADFAGSGKQVQAPINMPTSATLASVYYAVKAIIDPTIEANGGYYRAIQVITEEGTILNPHPPAPVGGRSDTAQRVVDVIFGALAQVVPRQVTAASNGTVAGMAIQGFHPRTGGYYAYLETIGGGFGARCNKDGPDGVQVHMTNTSNLPVECLEDEYPLRVERYELIQNSGGHGQYRGGMGIRRQLKLLAEEAWLSTKGDRHRFAPWGLAGGEAGRHEHIVINPGQPEERHLGSKNYHLHLRQGDVIVMETAGGGGYGEPLQRDPALQAADLEAEKVR